MAVINPQYDIDMNGLDNLLEGVVAFVEVRSDFEDISNDIAREMKQMGATVSDNRNNKVTHVIFRDGTLRTSNWAKKHNIPLVSVGWLAACGRNKIKLLCAPWRQPYMEEVVDACGLKKRMKYKKYCKWTNAEEFEADLNRSAERARKRLDKSLNKSQANASFEIDNNVEYDRVMKLSDPCLRPRPPTPEFVKKHRRRHERLRLGGRYSWESSDEDKDTSNNSSKSVDDLLIVDENVKPNQESLNCNEKSLGSSKEEISFKGARRLLKDDNSAIETLIEPIRKQHKRKVIQFVIPRAVLKKEETGSNGDKKRKRKRSSDDSPSPKRKKIIDMPLDISDILPINTKPLVDTPVIFNTATTSTTAEPQSKISLSPLITNKPSASSTPRMNFVTPNNKRKSLRTRLLKKSANRRLKDSMCSSGDDSFGSDKIFRGVLVPETDLRKGKNNMQKILLPPSPSDLSVVPETPHVNLFKNDIQSSSENPNSDSITSSIVGNIFDTPNASRVLNDMIPNRAKGQPIDHALFVAKDTYNHYSAAITPSFREQIQFIKDNFPRKSVSKIDAIIKTKPIKSAEEPPIVRRNVRRSVRLSNFPEILTTNGLTVFKPDEENKVDEAEVIFHKDNKVSEANGGKKTYNTRRSINVNKAKPLIKPITESRPNLKRPWSEANPKKILQIPVKTTKDTLKQKKFRDSTDDFVFNAKVERKPATRVSLSLSNTEIVIIGLDKEEQNGLRKECLRLKGKYRCVGDVISHKDQLVVVPDQPRRSTELVKGLMLGNVFVCVSWLHECVARGQWVESGPYRVPDTQLLQWPQASTPQIFREYSAMYIATITKPTPKYKLRLLIEQAGGTVTDSFRQAGVVIDTRKVNALSVTSAWILDSLKEGRVLDHSDYRIT